MARATAVATATHRRERSTAFVATQTLITSASSKTSISLAHCLAERDGHRSVGLTSDRNRSFVEGLGLYDDVITYDKVDQLDPSIASTMVDMAGNGSLRAAIHTHFSDQLKISLTVGATHWQDSGGGGALPGPTPEFFFAPGQSAKRSAEWGPMNSTLASPDPSTSYSTPPTIGSRLSIEPEPRA